MTGRGERPGADAGLTLVEVLITVFVGAVVLGLIATILATTLQATASTRDRDLATGRAQAISTSLTTSIRNSARVEIAAVPGGGTVVRARVATGGSGWECRAWAVVDFESWDAAGRRVGADGRFELRVLTYAPLASGAAAPAPAIAWGVLTEHVERAADASGTASPWFTLSGDHLSWNLTVVAAEQPRLSARSTAPVAGAAVALARQEGSSARCW